MSDELEIADGRYRLVRVLARGGMGEVWLAVQRGAGGFERPVVIKRVLAHLSDDPEFATRFIDEARIAAHLSHGNVVAVFDLGEDADGYYLAMEWVDGWDLRKLLRTLAADGERLPDALSLFVAAELAAGLQYAHARRGHDGRPLHIVHRDVSPSNVLISRAGEVKLTDFGIASARSRLGRTATGQLRGKFSYMSPEQASANAVDARSDVFAVGSLLFEMLTGRKAFDADGDVAVLELVRTGRRPSLAELRPDLDAASAAIVERAMAVSPSERFASAGELEAALREVLVERWGVVGSAALAGWLDSRLRDDAIFRAQDQPGGASLDELLNLQLDSAGDTSPSRTSSGGRARRAESGTGPVAVPSSRSERIVLEPRSHTMTRAALPARRRRRPVLWVAGAILALGAAGVAWAWPDRPELVVATTPSGATVYVDGVQVGVSELRTRVSPQARELQVRLAGYEPATRQLELERGDRMTVSLELEPEARAVEFHSVPPGALVSVEGREVLAGNSVRVPVGRPVRVRMSLDGHAPLDEEVTFAAGDTVLTRRLSPLPEVAALSDPDGDGDEGRARTEASARSGEPQSGLGRAASSGAASPPVARTAEGQPGAATGPDAADATDGPSADAGTAATGTAVIRFVEAPMVGEIFIDGVSRGSNSELRQAFVLPAGRHVVRVVNAAAGVAFEGEVELGPDQTRTVSVDWR